MLSPPVADDAPKGTVVSFGACLERFFGDVIVDGVNCSKCNKKTTFTKRNRFSTFPKVLIIAL